MNDNMNNRSDSAVMMVLVVVVVVVVVVVMVVVVLVAVVVAADRTKRTGNHTVRETQMLNQKDWKYQSKLR